MSASHNELVAVPGGAAGVHALATGAAAATGLGVPKPFETKVLLIEGITVAGTTHVEGIHELAKSLDEGVRLGLRHQSDNRHDRWSVEVLHPTGAHLGFLPTGKNDVIARLLDGGKTVFAQVVGVRTVNNWVKISIEVYLND